MNKLNILSKLENAIKKGDSYAIALENGNFYKPSEFDFEVIKGRWIGSEFLPESEENQ